MKLTNNIDKLGTAGLFLTALLSPCCFPLFAVVASALGLAIVSGGLIIYSYNFYDTDNWTILLYIGMFGLLSATAINYYIKKK